MIETSSFLTRKSLVKFGNLQKVFRNPQEIIKKKFSLVCLYSKQNMTQLLVDMEFLFSCSTFSQVSTVLTPDRSSWKLTEKFHIYVQPCIVLYMYRKQWNVLIKNRREIVTFSRDQGELQLNFRTIYSFKTWIIYRSVKLSLLNWQWL